MNCAPCLRWSLLAVAILFATASPLVAQKPPDPDVAYIFPPGAQRGTTVAVQLAGFDWTPDLEFFVLDPRFQLKIDGPLGRLLMPEPPFPVGIKAYRPPALPREVAARLVIPADFPPGPVRWQVANANGSSNTGVFIVGDGPEIVEHRQAGSPQLIASLPVTVSGQLSRYEEVDCYLVEATQSGLVTCDLHAQRLGSNFNGVLEVRDAEGKLVADAVDSQGTDVAVTYFAEAGRRYRICVRDLNFRGNRAYVYRLQLTTGPRVLAAFPAAGQRGAIQEVEFVGYGLASGKCQLERVKRRISFPADPASSSFDCRFEAFEGSSTLFRIELSDIPEIVEGTLGTEVSMSLALPVAVTGLLDRNAPKDRFRLDGKQGQIWNIRVQARRIGSPLDVAVAILGADGKELAANDDLPGTTDVGLEFPVPAEGAYEVVVTDVSGLSPSPLNIYRLVANRASPDFSLQIQQHLNVPLGEKTELVVKAGRIGGFRGPIELTMEGLREGVTVPPDLVIPAEQSEFKVPLQCAADASSGAAFVTLMGKAQIAGEWVSHPAFAAASGNLAPRDPEEISVPQLLIASTMKPVTKIRPIETDERTVHRGTIHLAELAIERLQGFTGDVIVQMDSKQPAKFRRGILGPDVIVPPGQDRLLYPCLVPDAAETVDAYRVLLVAVAQCRDPKGTLRTLLSKMQTDDASVAITVEGALLKISSSATETTARRGETIQLPLRVARSPKLREAVQVEVRIPAELAGQMSAEVVIVPVDQDELTIPLQFAADAKVSGKHVLTIRATAFQPGRPPVISEGHGASPMDFDVVAILKSGRLPVIAELAIPLEVQGD